MQTKLFQLALAPQIASHQGRQHVAHMIIVIEFCFATLAYIYLVIILEVQWLKQHVHLTETHIARYLFLLNIYEFEKIFHK
jgi:presenilin-like A22 family membrane protease